MRLLEIDAFYNVLNGNEVFVLPVVTLGEMAVLSRRRIVFFLSSFFVLLFLACAPDPRDYPELGIEDLRVGNGLPVGSWDTIHVHYTGRVLGGKVFDTSRDQKEPSVYSMRGKTLIEGWRIGLLGMKVGGRRRLTIPAQLAFGKQGKLGRFAPESTLVFDIELLAVE